jgi:hypothetical protein
MAMDPEDRRLLNEIHGNTSGIKAIVEMHTGQLQRLDSRVGELEVRSAEQDVKTTRQQQDLDGLGRKVRAQGERRLAASSKPENEGSRWLAFLEALAAVPKWAHVIVTLGSTGVTAAVLLWRHWPR